MKKLFNGQQHRHYEAAIFVYIYVTQKPMQNITLVPIGIFRGNVIFLWNTIESAGDVRTYFYTHFRLSFLYNTTRIKIMHSVDTCIYNVRVIFFVSSISDTS